MYTVSCQTCCTEELFQAGTVNESGRRLLAAETNPVTPSAPAVTADEVLLSKAFNLCLVNTATRNLWTCGNLLENKDTDSTLADSSCSV